MRRLAALLSATVIILLATACNDPAKIHDAAVRAIRDNETQWNQDWAAKDPDKIAAHYSTDAILMVPGMAATSGREAIAESLKQMTSDPALSLKFQASKIEVAKSGDLAYTQGSYTLTLTEPTTKQVINDHGSYVTTYRKVADGPWKAVADIATSEVPPPPPPTAHVKAAHRKAATHAKPSPHKRSKRR